MKDETFAIEMALEQTWGRAWICLLIVTLIGVVSVETTLLAMGTGYLGGGFNSVHVDGRGLLAFLIGATVLDAAVVLGIWAVLVPIGKRLASGRIELFCGSALLGLGVPLTVAAIHYNLVTTLGRLVNPSLLGFGSSGSSVGMVSILLEELVGLDRLLMVLALGGGVLLLYGIRRFGAGIPFASGSLLPPSTKRLWVGFVLASVAGAVLLMVSAQWNQRVHYGLARTTGGMVLPLLLRVVTDFDGDGYGWIDRPADFAPFDGSLHPYAHDIPGNGIDENGVGGDHPAAFTPEANSDNRSGEGVLPHFLLIYLESFRADLLDRKYEGQAITPFLNQFADSAARSEHAFVHSPWTLPSRAQLFSGSLVAKPGARTLIDDFKARGYQIAYFSGQDDSYGDSTRLLGVERADVFYDARQDVDRRTSRTALSVSLQVSWKTVLERVEVYLAHADPAVPQFLYVNIVDTHFPYTHDELDDILGVKRISRSEIRADNADQIRATYANTAANVDRAVEQVVRAFGRRFRGRPQAIVVTADHGQAFYEEGTLGHGQTLAPGETRVPLIVWGLGGDWPEPIAPSDLRGLVSRNLARRPGDDTPLPRFVPDPKRRILQYLGGLAKPKRVAARSIDRLLVYDLVRGSVELKDSAGRPLSAEPTPEEVASLIWSWESAQTAAEEAVVR